MVFLWESAFRWKERKWVSPGERCALPRAQDAEAEESQLSSRETYRNIHQQGPNVVCVQWESEELETL